MGGHRSGTTVERRPQRAYRQLSNAEYEFVDLRKRRRLSPARLDELAEAQPVRSFAALSDELVALTKVVEALGGHVEVRAVFEDGTITLLREPAPPDEGPPAAS